MTDRQPLTKAEMREEISLAAHMAFKNLRVLGVPATCITLTADFSDGEQISVPFRPKEENGK